MSEKNARHTPEFDGWPSIQVHVEVLPWHWDWRPRWHQDWDCTSSCSLSWLFLRVEWWANRPLFPTEAASEPVISGLGRSGCMCGTDATSLDSSEVVVHGPGGCHITRVTPPGSTHPGPEGSAT